MALALQRPLFQGATSGILDRAQIRAILTRVKNRMIPVRVSFSQDACLYHAYVEKFWPNAAAIDLRMPAWGDAATAPSIRPGARMTVSFAFRERALFFDTGIAGIFKRDVRIWFPHALSVYPTRGAHRLAHPFSVPMTVEFVDPRTQRGWRVHDLEDLGYHGLSFRCADEAPPPPGIRIPRLNLYSFERRCYATAARVLHVRECRDAAGSCFRRVSVIFASSHRRDAHRAPARVAMGTGRDELNHPPTIQSLLNQWLYEKLPVTFNDAEKRRSPIQAVPHPPFFDEGALVFRLLPQGPAAFPFRVGEQIRGECVHHDTLFRFATILGHSAGGRMRVGMPVRITRLRRRRTPRCPSVGHSRIRIALRNPLSNNIISKPIADLSEDGFSMSLDYKRAMLFPGMMIEGTQLHLPDGRYRIPSVQVLYAKTLPSLRGRPRCRVGFVWKHLSDATRRAIGDVLRNLRHPRLLRPGHASVAKIWDLYDQAGFLYPAKKAAISQMQEEIDETWEKLYAPETPFFLNLTLTIDGQIVGSGAILQIYDSTWLLQHLSALPNHPAAVSKEINLGLVEELMRDRKIWYIKTYFRPNNPWPNKTFRAFAEKRLKPGAYDLTRYHFFQRDPSPLPVAGSLPAGVAVGALRRGDGEIIRNYFVRAGKVFFARAESLLTTDCSLRETSERYRRRGLLRDRRIFVAKKTGALLAFVLAEDASFGLNLSGLLNTCRLYLLTHDPVVLADVLPHLLNRVLAFYHSRGYQKVLLGVSDGAGPVLAPLGFEPTRDYYGLTFHRESLLEYLHFIHDKYARLERRMGKRRPDLRKGNGVHRQGPGIVS